MAKKKTVRVVRGKSPVIRAAQFKLLERLCNAVSVSGDESEVRKIVLDELKPHAQDIRVDALGNVLVTKRGRPIAKVVPIRNDHSHLIGALAGKFEILGDILSTGEKWDAES